MRRPRNRMSQNAMAEEIYATMAVVAVVVLVALVWTAVLLGASIDHLAAPPKNPVALVIELFRKNTPWPPAATYLLGGELAAVGLIAGVTARVISHVRSSGELVDILAKRLPRNAKALRRYTDQRHAPVAPEVGKDSRSEPT
jgi:hypothetical protein